jgi:hypothetical protein
VGRLHGDIHGHTVPELVLVLGLFLPCRCMATLASWRPACSPPTPMSYSHAPRTGTTHGMWLLKQATSR